MDAGRDGELPPVDRADQEPARHDPVGQIAALVQARALRREVRVAVAREHHRAAVDLDLVGLPGGSGAPGAAPALPEGKTLKDAVDDAVRAVEKAAIEAALAREGGSPAKAARALGISRASIYNKLKEYGIHAGEDRP